MFHADMKNVDVLVVCNRSEKRNMLLSMATKYSQRHNSDIGIQYYLFTYSTTTRILRSLAVKICTKYSLACFPVIFKKFDGCPGNRPVGGNMLVQIVSTF